MRGQAKRGLVGLEEEASFQSRRAQRCVPLFEMTPFNLTLSFLHYLPLKGGVALPVCRVVSMTLENKRENEVSLLKGRGAVKHDIDQQRKA